MLAKLTMRRVAIGVALGCLGAHGTAASGAEPGDLGGVWAIDRDASDEPADVLEAVTRRSSGRLGGVRADVSIFGIGVGEMTELFPERSSGGTEPQDAVRRELGTLQRHLTESLTRLDIEQSADTLHVVYDDLGIYVYRTGQTVEYADTIVTAGWRGDRYVVDREVQDGPRVTETFRAGRDGRTLHWTVAIELESRGDVTIERVFVRDTGE